VGGHRIDPEDGRPDELGRPASAAAAAVNSKMMGGQTYQPPAGEGGGEGGPTDPRASDGKVNTIKTSHVMSPAIGDAGDVPNPPPGPEY